MIEGEWTQKGGTLSDKSATKEFGISKEDIFQAIRDGKLQYRENHIHGNPYFRLLRREVESFVTEKYGKDYLEQQSLNNELSQVNSKLRSLKREMNKYEKRKVQLMEIINTKSKT